MKIKRIAALLLTVCLMLSMGIVPVLAAEAGATETYSFDYYTALINGGKSAPERGYFKWAHGLEPLTELYTAGTINSMPIAVSSADNKEPTLTPGYIGLSPAYVGDWVAFKFKSPATAGTYSVDVAWFGNTYNARSCGVYIFPAADDINGNVNNNTLVGAVDLKNEDLKGTAGNITLEASKEYIVVFKTLKNWNDNESLTIGDKNTYGGIRLVSMNLKAAGNTPSASTPSESTPSASTPSASTPSASTPTGSNPSTGENSGIVVMAALVIASFAAVSLVLLTNNKRKHA